MRRALLATAVVALLGAAAGCGYQGTVEPTPQAVVGTLPKAAPEPTSPAFKLKGDPTKGKAIFASTGCGSCHTLKAAGATGTIGPNFDQVKPTYKIATTFIWFGKAAMPDFGKSGQLTAQQVADVAAYVVQSTGGTP
jgi:cytochrome c6